MKNIKALYIFITALIILIFDQLTKIWAFSNLSEPMQIIPNFFKFQLTTNTGAGFGFLKGFNNIFIWIIIIVVGLILYYYNDIPEKKYMWISFGLILGGALGNLIDRIRLGFVIDFLDLTFWPSFNIADSAITIAAILIGVYIIYEK
tara:strand:- start:2702 stop:3142 length:441 start_codon:yes stop_codon:yes gene_type:complete